MADVLSRLPYKYVEKGEHWNAEEDVKYPFSHHAEDTVTVFAPKSKPVMCVIVAALVDAAPKSSFKVTIDNDYSPNLRQVIRTTHDVINYCM